MIKSKLSCWRFTVQFWPLLAMFILAQWLMRISGNIASIAIPWWLSLLDTLVFTVAFMLTARWVHSPVRRALKHLKTSSKRSMHYLEHCVTLLPKRAIKGFLIAGISCAFYLLAVLSLGAWISHSQLTPRMLLSLGLTLLYGVGVLAPAVALAMTLSYTARMRHFLSEKGLFLHTLGEGESLVSWNKVSKRPWIIFTITSALPVSILALFVNLILGAGNSIEQHFILLQAGILCLSLLMAGTWLTFVVGNVVQRTVNTLTAALRRLQHGEFEQAAPILLDDEFGVLARGINTALTGLKEREEMKQNLIVASDIHQAMLPQHTPDIPHYQLQAFQQSCQAVGGDYYDHIHINDEHIWLVVADVAGKGYPAALSVASLHAMIHALAHLHMPLEAAARYINRNLCETLTGGRFITLFMADLNTQTHELEWINAGHLPVLCCHQEHIETLPASAPPMGLQIELNFPGQTHSIQQGEVLLAYSDGITEARHADSHEMLGEKYLHQWLIQHADDNNKVKALQQTLNDWGELAADDDVTMLFLQRNT